MSIRTEISAGGHSLYPSYKQQSKVPKIKDVPFKFLTLPAELRFMIEEQCDGPTLKNLRKTCQFLREEATPVFWNQTWFYLNPIKQLIWPLQGWNHGCGPFVQERPFCLEAARRVQRLTIDLNTDPPWRCLNSKKGEERNVWDDLFEFFPRVKFVMLTGCKEMERDWEHWESLLEDCPEHLTIGRDLSWSPEAGSFASDLDSMLNKRDSQWQAAMASANTTLPLVPMTDRKFKRLLDDAKLEQDKSRQVNEEVYMERHQVYVGAKNSSGTSGVPTGVYYIKCEALQQGFVVSPMSLSLRGPTATTLMGRGRDIYDGHFHFGRIKGIMGLTHVGTDMSHPGPKRMPFRWDGIEFLPEHGGWAESIRANRTGFIEFTDGTFTRFHGKLRNSAFAKYEIEIQGFKISD